MAKYDAFISYSHSVDGVLAPKIRDGLQMLAKPWNRRRALKVFLDQASLELTAGLEKSLRSKLASTEWLIVLLSEDSARSEWVGAEIVAWVTTKPKGRIVLVHTDGELYWGDGDWDYQRSTAAPTALSKAYDEEPLWLDLRGYREDADLNIRTNRVFREDLATLAAPIHGMSKEDLVGEDLVRFRRAKRLRRSAITGLVVLTLVAAVTAVFAVQNASEADRQRADAIVARNDAIAARDAEETARIAEETARIAEEAARMAEEQQRLMAEEEARIANSRRMAAEALQELDSRVEVEGRFVSDDVPAELARRRSRGLLLALTAVSIERTGEAVGSLAEGLLDGAGPEPIGVWLADPTIGRVLVAFGPNGNIAAAGRNGTVQYWANPQSDSGSVTLDGTDQTEFDQRGHPVAFHPNGDLLASGGGGTVLLWDLTQLEDGPPIPEALQPLHTSRVDFRAPVRGLAFSADGQLLVSGGDDGRVIVWDVTDRIPVGDPFATNSSITDVAINENRTLVTATTSGGALHVWSITTNGERIEHVELQYLESGTVSGVDFGVGNVVAASSWAHDQTLTVWDSPLDHPSDTLTLTLQGEGFTAQDVSFNVDGTTLASAGETVRLWTLADRQPAINLVGHPNGVNDVEFSPDGTALVSGGLFSGGVIVWDLSLDTWIKLACREAGRNMTQREWDRFVGTDVDYQRTCAAFDSGEGAPASASPTDF